MPVESIINISVQNIDDDISMTTVLYDAPNEFSDLVTWTSINSGNNVNRFWKVCTPGTYYLKLFDNGNNDRSSQSYDLMISIDSTDIYECNDTELTAYELQVCSDTLYAAINLEGDEDYFSFTAPANININVEVTNVPSNIDMEIEIITPSGNTLPIGSGNNGSNAVGNHLTSQEGTYILHFYDDGNNEFNSALYQAVINLIPEFNLPSDFEDLCIDEAPIELSGGSPMGGYYSGVGVDSTTGFFNPIEAGVGSHTITFTFVDTTISCSSSVSETITVHDLPNVSFTLTIDTVFLTDDAFTLQGGMPVGGIYTGTGVDSMSGEFDPSIGIGTYEISYTYTDAFGCSNFFNDSITVVQMTSIVPIAIDASIVASPNPFSDKLNIDFGNLSEKPTSITIFNVNGNAIFYSEEILTEKFEINFEDSPSGIYFIRFQIGNESYSTRVIKQ